MFDCLSAGLEAQAREEPPDADRGVCGQSRGGR